MGTSTLRIRTTMRSRNSTRMESSWRDGGARPVPRKGCCIIPADWPPARKVMCTWPTAGTIASRSSMRKGTVSMPGGSSGSPGVEMGKFDVPWGVTTDHAGNLYVSDTSNARIQQFKADGTPLLKWGRDGSFDGAFFYPRGMAVDF